MRTPSSLFPQIGSKSRLSAKIVEFLPQQFAKNVEPFVGTGSIYFRLMKEGVIPRDASVVLNDFDSEISNAFTVARDRTEELCRAVELTPYSAGEVGQATDTAGDPVERARRFLAHAHLSFVGAEPLRRFSIGGEKKRPERWARVPDELRMLMEPLKRATITRLDALECIEKFEGEDTLLVIDPPYIGREHYYRARFDAHEELARLLSTVEAAGVIVTHTQHPDLDRLYPAVRWERHSVEQTITSTNRWSETQSRTVEVILVRKEARGIGHASRCEQCGKQFVMMRSDSKYCSSACRSKAFRRTAKRV